MFGYMSLTLTLAHLANNGYMRVCPYTHSLEVLLKNSLDPCYAMHLIRHVRIVGRLPTCKVSFHIFVIQILH